MSVGNCACARLGCPGCLQSAVQDFDFTATAVKVPGFRVGISAPLNPNGQVSFEVETAALAACIRELATLDHESRHRVLVNLVDRYEERRKL